MIVMTKEINLPPLPHPAFEGFEDCVMFSSVQMTAYAHAAVAHFLDTTGQYVTNDASREAAIRAAVEADRAGRLALTDDEILKVADAVHLSGWDMDAIPDDLLVDFARAVLAREGQTSTYPGADVAERLDSMADAQPAGSQSQSDLYAAATMWRKHIRVGLPDHIEQSIEMVARNKQDQEAP